MESSQMTTLPYLLYFRYLTFTYLKAKVRNTSVLRTKVLINKVP